MARKLIVEILGDSRSLERSFQRSSRSADKFGKDMTGVAGRVDKTFSRVQRVAAGGFIGGVAASAAIQGIRTVVNAAAESQQVLGQTRVALDATGQSWAQYGKQIEETIQAQSRLGFDDEALLRTFSLFVRQTNDVGQALRENNLAMDVARARFIDLEQAANIVNKAALGQAGALRRLGIDTRGATTGTELLTLLTEKYGGAAERASGDATTAFDRSKVAIENLEESLGTLLLPAITEISNELADTADAAVILVEKLKQIGNVRIPTIHIPFAFDVPGTGGTIGNLAGKAFDVAKFVGPYRMVFVAQEIAKRLADDFDKGAAMAQVELANSFGRSINTMTSNALDAAAGSVKPVKAPRGFGTGLTPEDLFGPLIKQLPAEFQEGILDAEIAGKGIRQAHVEARDRIVEALEDPRLRRADRIALKRALQTENAAIKAFDDDVAQGIKDANDKRKARLEKLAADAKKAAEDHKQRLEEIAEARRKAAEEAAKALQARQFRALGLGPEGAELIPGVKNLRKQLDQLSDRLGPDISSKLSGRLKGVAKVLRGDFGKVTEETRSAIKDLFDTIRGTFDEEANKPIAERRVVNLSDKILRALGLGEDPDVQRLVKAARSRFQVPALTQIPSVRTATTAPGGVNINGPITVVADNPDVFLRELQKKAGRTTATSRGRSPGRSLGLG